MVRVVSAHHFNSQVVQTCEDTLAVTTAPPDRLLIALPHHVVEVRDLSADGKTILTFPTVDRVTFLNYCTAEMFAVGRFCILKGNMNFPKQVFRGKMLLRWYCHSTKRKIFKTKSEIIAEPKKRSKNATEIIKHFAESKFFQDNLNYIDYKFLERKVGMTSTITVVDEQVAKNIVGAIKSELIKNSSPVFEANPGLGLITKELLKLDLFKICLFETDPLFKRGLDLLLAENKERLKLYSSNIFEIWNITFLDKLDNGKRLQGLMEGVSVTEWEGNPCVKIIGVLASPRFLQSVMASIVFRQGITTYGRPELFLLISPLLYSSIMKPNGGTLTLFNIFFECQCLMKVDSKACLPWILCKPKTAKKLTNNNIDCTKFYLIKATPRKNLYQIIKPEFMKPLWYFVKSVIRGRRYRVVPQMEKWIPNCGPRLIAKGIGAFTAFGDISPEKLLEIFLDFISWPEFNSSSFLTAMEDYLMKAEKDIDENTTELNIDENTTELIAEDRTDFLQEGNVLDLSNHSQEL